MMDDIHDIRPPVMVGMDPVLVKTAVWTVGGLVLVILVFLAVRYLLKRRKAKTTAMPVLPEIPPYETAIGALDRLATGPVHDAKIFYFDLGRIIKTYVGATYGFNCLEMTTQELGRRLKGISDLPGSLKSEITLFQDLCDPFRYAPLIPDQNQVNQDLIRGRNLVLAVEASKPGKTEED